MDEEDTGAKFEDATPGELVREACVGFWDLFGHKSLKVSYIRGQSGTSKALLIYLCFH